jgi:hypothetical protein
MEPAATAAAPGSNALQVHGYFEGSADINQTRQGRLLFERLNASMPESACT